MVMSKKTGILRKTLSDRFTELHESPQAANSESCQCLDNAQEEALIRMINRLTNRRLPPTNSIVRNLKDLPSTKIPQDLNSLQQGHHSDLPMRS